MIKITWQVRACDADGVWQAYQLVTCEHLPLNIQDARAGALALARSIWPWNSQAQSMGIDWLVTPTEAELVPREEPDERIAEQNWHRGYEAGVEAARLFGSETP